MPNTGSNPDWGVESNRDSSVESNHASRTAAAGGPPPDHRPALAAAQHWVAQLIDGVAEQQLDHPTPCSDFTVRQLLEHLLAVQNRIAVVAETGSIESSPRTLPLPDVGGVAGASAAFRDATARAQRAWSPDATLTAGYQLPWGTVPGFAAVAGYVAENVAHGWDLAVATGQPSEADPALAELALRSYDGRLPDEIRGTPGVPFGPRVEPAPDAGPTERLANFLGRNSR